MVSMSARPAGVVAGGLGVEVAHHLVGQPHVGADHFQQDGVGFARVEQLHDGDPKPLLVDLPGLGGQDAAADVRGVAGVGEERHKPPGPEDRRGDGDVVDVSGGLPRVVGDEHVPGRQGIRGELPQEMPHGRGHGVDVARRATDRLGHHAALGVEETAGQVLALPHDGAEGGPHERVLLLVGHGQKPVPDDLEGYGIDGGIIHNRTPRSH